MQISPIELSPLVATESTASAAPSERLAALAGVKAEVSVVAGTASTSVGEILALREGAVLKLSSLLTSPFDLVLNGVVLARGELVAVGENFGIRITQVQASQRA